MKRRALAALLVAVFGCAAPSGDGAPAASGGDAEAASSTTTDVLRTADPFARGYTEADFPRVREVADGVYTYEALRSAGDERFTTVSLFVVTDDGVLVADGQGNPEETAKLVQAVAGVTDQPIRHVVICSDHGDHTGGNSAFPEGVTFYANPTSAAVLKASAEHPRDGAPPVIVPTEMVPDQRVLNLGGREIDIRFLGRAHTGGDLVVYLPAEKVLFMSETFLNRVFPAMRSAYPSEWVAMVKKAQAMDVDVYVPGHGFVDSPTVLKEELETYREAMESVIAEATRLHDEGLSADEAVEQARFGPLEEWSLRSSQGAVAVRRVYMELDGELPGA